MNPSKFMDKQITELSPSTIHDFPYFSDLHEEEDEEDHLFSSSNFRPIRSFPNSSSVDCLDSPKTAFENVGTSYDGALISVIDEKMKEHTDNFLHVVDDLITRLSHLEGRTRNIESYVDDLKVSTEYSHGRTNGKLRQLENTLREVEGGVKDLRDKQEIVGAQLQLAKLQVSKGKLLQSENQISGTQVHIVQGISSPVPQQTHQLLPVPVSCQQPLPTLLSNNASPSVNHQNPPPPASAAVQLPTQITQNQISSSDPGSYYLSNPTAPGTSRQQCQIPPVPQSQVPPSVPHQSYQPAPQLQTSQSPQSPNMPPHLSAVNPQVPLPPSGRPPKEIPYMSSQSYTPSFYQPPFQPPSSAPSTQHFFYEGSTLKMHEEPPGRPNSEFPTGYGTSPPCAYAQSSSDFYACSGSNSYSNDSTMRPSQFSPLASVPSSGTSYPQLPSAKILPHALPTASSVDDGGSGPSVKGNRMSSDDVVDKIAAMGFRRDLVRATVMKLTDNGQSADLNIVLDKLMNDGEDHAQRVWFTQ